MALFLSIVAGIELSMGSVLVAQAYEPHAAGWKIFIGVMLLSTVPGTVFGMVKEALRQEGSTR